MPSARLRAILIGSVTVNVAVYASLAIYLWFSGNAAGMVFGMVMLAGGMLHVSVHMHDVRAFVIASIIPYTLYFLGLPIVQSIMTREPLDLLIAVGGILYMTHLGVTIRQGSQSTKALKEANELARAAAERANIASSAKSDFLATISHEIRTPMNAVISAGQSLNRTQLDATQRDQVEMLLDSGGILVALLNDILDFSKIEAGKMELNPASVDVPERLKAMQRIWSERAEQAGSDLRLTIDDSVPSALHLDPLRFQQIVFNLVSNAVKFTQDGHIDVRAHWSAAENMLEIEVEDTGCGIPADRLGAIFEVFEQADARTTRRFGGTGLGLAISRRLAELMGGSLVVRSEVGLGSRFVAQMPCELADVVEAAHPTEVPTGSIAGLSILVAEDHPVNRKIIAHVLEPFGAVISFAENGAIAVDHCRTNRFDVILMDMQMPVMDGLEASRQIIAENLAPATPIIALTANVLDVHREAWSQVGAAGFVAKPIEHGLLITTILHCVQAARLDDLRPAA
ncbi:ATP-binding protein [Brevundimonas variabilis]|uniref:histidine kinase n=1 Tax=Brevundimonas variabilis TaxID=74312 RepID=A0A7W9FHQ2_9CAUL|nr:ATP-binding protein [Brevundimonas variabilis]MBB5747689.1 signal transduction histidine kinase/ActR/RegA family two-component response regulator [Brevundimonas variabilis]